MRLRLLALLFLFTAAAVVAQPPAEKKADDPRAEKKADDKKAESKKDDAKKPDDKKADAKKDEKKAPAKPKAVLKVTLPDEKAELKILGQATKTTGKVREFDIPDVEAGAPLEYEVSAKWEPNNYTTITRTKTVSFKGGDVLVSVDLSGGDEKTDKVVIRWVPTPDDIVTKMLELAKVGPDDTVFDLGCGDGKIVIAAVKEKKAKKGVGIDLDAEKVKEAKAAAEAAKVADKVAIRQGDILEMKDLGDATVVCLYLSDEFGAVLKTKLLRELKPGTRVVSHRFTLGDWKPEKTTTVTGADGDEYTLHQWTVPAKK